MNKPKFNPNQPFQVAGMESKPKFNPSAPFDVADSEPEEEQGLLSQGLDYGLRGLDYAGGVGRYAAAGLANIPYSMATGKSLTKTDDLGKVLKGQGPTTAEYMERGGVPEGPRFNLSPAEGDTSLRDMAGFAGDIATDPLTYVGMPGIGKTGKPVAEATEALGKRTYKSGFKKIDERLAEQGKKPISDVLLENGAPSGTTKKISGDMKKIGKESLDERGTLYKKATDKGVVVDLGYPLKETESLLAEARKTPGVRRKIGDLEDILNDFKREGKVDIQTLSDWKSRLYEALPDSAFGPDGRPRGLSGKFDKALSSDIRKAIIEAGNKAEPGLGNKIDKLNETMGSVISAKKPTKIQIRRGETPNLVTSVDAMMAGLGGAGAIPLKKGADVAKTTYARTKVGKGLIKSADSGLLDPAARRGLIDKKKKNDKRN